MVNKHLQNVHEQYIHC